MKRYLVFKGYRYYPSGGWNDFEGDFATHEEAEIVAKVAKTEDEDQWSHIIDTDLYKEETDDTK